MTTRTGRPDRPGNAFLTSQLGAHAAADFASRMRELGMTPPQAGLLRAISLGPGRSQQSLAEHLGTAATRLVGLLDELADRGLVERRRNPTDRRLHALYLTDAGQETVTAIGRIATAQDQALFAALDDSEQETLRGLLARVAEHQGLLPGVHPGYRRLRAGGDRCEAPTDVAVERGPGAGGAAS